jgi:hypothetical protein
MQQDLYKPKAYPADVRAELAQNPGLMTNIANRWMLGWPDRVKGLLATGEYLPALREQVEKETRVYAENSGMSHLSSWELAEVCGLTQDPPFPTE